MQTPVPKKGKKIIYVSPYYDPAVPSGANRRFDEICSRLAKDFGENFTLVVSQGKTPSWWTGGNLEEVDYRFSHATKFSSAREIAQILDAKEPSIVIMESIPIPFRALKRHLHIQTAYDFRYFHSFSKSALYRLLFTNFLKRQWRRCQYILTCSEFSIDELERFVGFPRERVIKSFFGINEKIFDTPRSGEKEYDIIYVGHFDRHKNHAPLIDALALLDKSLKVLFIGVDNGLESSLKERATRHGLSNVEFKTVRDEKKVWEYYTKSKLFVSPSLYEGFGMPTIEALALGLPATISDIQVFHEVGGDLVTYFDPTDPKDIASKISNALKSGDIPPQEQVKAQLEQFLWKNIYRKFLSDISNLTLGA